MNLNSTIPQIRLNPKIALALAMYGNSPWNVVFSVNPFCEAIGGESITELPSPHQTGGRPRIA